MCFRGVRAMCVFRGLVAMCVLGVSGPCVFLGASGAMCVFRGVRAMCVFRGVWDMLYWNCPYKFLQFYGVNFGSLFSNGRQNFCRYLIFSGYLYIVIIK